MQKNRQILIHHAIPSGRRLIGPRFTFQQDNDPKYTANKVKRYLKSKEDQGVLELMEWPPQSPDLNIIEAIWDHLDRKTTKFTGRAVGSPSERMQQHFRRCSAETAREHSQKNSSNFKAEGWPYKILNAHFF